MRSSAASSGWLRVGSMRSCSQSRCSLVRDVHVLDAERAAVGLLQALDQLAERLPRRAAGRAPDRPRGRGRPRRTRTRELESGWPAGCGRADPGGRPGGRARGRSGPGRRRRGPARRPCRDRLARRRRCRRPGQAVPVAVGRQLEAGEEERPALVDRRRDRPSSAGTARRRSPCSPGRTASNPRTRHFF